MNYEVGIKFELLQNYSLSNKLIPLFLKLQLNQHLIILNYISLIIFSISKYLTMKGFQGLGFRV